MRRLFAAPAHCRPSRRTTEPPPPPSASPPLFPMLVPCEYRTRDPWWVQVPLSKSRLKSDLVAHNVPLPSDHSRKEVYVGLHAKHIDPKHGADFSSDEEEEARGGEDGQEDGPSGEDMQDITGLTDDELKASLLQHGVRTGPIVASTRAVYERRLQKLLQSYGPAETAANGVGDAAAYSDSEEEEEEDDEGDKEGKEEESGKARAAGRPGCWEPHSVRNAGNAVKSALEAGRPHAPSGLSAKFSVDEPPGLAAAVPTPVSTSDEGSGSSASSRSRSFSITRMVEEGSGRPTSRRPIKGAAGRPVQYKYPDVPPASPLTLERREVERRLVPFYIQLLVFLALACVLNLVFICMEDSWYNPLLPLLEGLSEVAGSEEGQTAGQTTADPVDLLAQDSLSG
ncbi:unnamed protein product [Merluccius merluccius]